MRTLYFLFSTVVALLFFTSCTNDFGADLNDGPGYAGNTIEARTFSTSEFEIIEEALHAFFLLDSASLDSLNQVISENANAYVSAGQVFSHFGISDTILTQLLALDPDEIMEDADSFIVDEQFASSYISFIKSGSSRIFSYEGGQLELRWSWRNLFNDPCGLGATVTLVGYYAVTIIAGGSSVGGPVLAVASVANEIVSYAVEC